MPSTLPPPAVRRTGVPTIRSVARHQWQGRRLSLDALTGQVGTLTRAATGTMVDSNGATVTAAHSMPRWESRTWLGSAGVGLRLAADDLTWTCGWSLEEGTLLVEAIEVSSIGSGKGLAYIGRDDDTGNRLVVRGTGSTFAVDLKIGANTSTATFGSAVAADDDVQLVVQVDDDGVDMKVRIGGAVNGTPVAFSAWGTSIARGTAWGTGAKVRANRVGSAGSQGSTWLRSLAWFPAVALTLDEATGRL